MAKKVCPGCGQKVPTSESKCRYCSYPFEVIRNLKNESIDNYLKDFEVAYSNSDRDTVLQVYGVLKFLNYKYINICRAKIHIMDKEYEEATEILSSQIIKNQGKKEALLLSLQVFALEGKYLELCKLLNKYSKDFDDVWKTIFYYFLCVENHSYEEHVRYADEFEKGKVQTPFIEISKMSEEDFEVVSSIHFKAGDALIRGMEEAKRQVLILRVSDDDIIFTENDNQIVRNSKHILSCYPAFFESKMDPCDILDGFLDALTGDTSDADEYNKKLRISEERVDEGLEYLFIKNNPLGKLPSSIVEYMSRLYGAIPNDLIRKKVKLYEDVLCEQLEKGVLKAWELLMELDVFDLIPDSASELLSYVNKLDEADTDNVLSSLRKETTAFKALTPNGWKALQVAEWCYIKSKEEDYAGKDAGPLSLNYFRILELELNRRLICPLVDKAGHENIKNVYENELRRLSDKNAKRNYSKKWGICVQAIENIGDLSKSVDGMELGKLSRFLKAVRTSREERIGAMLYPYMTMNLTEKGITAYESGEIEGLISQDKLNKFRNPPAHTKYLPYNVACECREYVLNSLEKIGEWFVIKEK